MGKVKKYSYSGWKVREPTHLLDPEANRSRDREYMESLVADVEKNVQGKRVLVEGEDDEVIVAQ